MASRARRPGILTNPHAAVESDAVFPWRGGKSRVASAIWERLGAVRTYVEPFLGSGAVWMACPYDVGYVILNDLDGWVVNAWRAIRGDPAEVLRFAECPASQLDLHARRAATFRDEAKLTKALEADPEYFDAKIAGWWIWGQCVAVPGSWRPADFDDRPHFEFSGINKRAWENTAEQRLKEVARKIRRAIIVCGDWTRSLPQMALNKPRWPVGVMLDPPYGGDRHKCYTKESFSVQDDVRRWAIEQGRNDFMRIALCGYEGSHDMPADWEVFAWPSKGSSEDNKDRERIWFSPGCLGRDSKERLDEETRNRMAMHLKRVLRRK